MSIKTDIQRISADAALFHQVVHGDTSSTVTTDQGNVPSLAKAVADASAPHASAASAASAAAASATAAAQSAATAASVVTGGTAQTARAAGKIPISDAWGSIAPWLAKFTIYLDASTGNDANPGTSGSQMRTIEAAIAKIPEGCSAVLWLQEGQTFTLAGVTSIGNRKIRLDCANDSNRAIVTTTVVASGEAYQLGGQLDMDGGQLVFNQVNVTIPARPDTVYLWSERKSLVRLRDTEGGRGHVSLRRVAINVSDSNAFARVHVGGVLSCSVNTVTVTAGTGGGSLIGDTGNGAVSLGAYALTLNGTPTATVINSLNNRGDGVRNILTNYTGTLP